MRDGVDITERVAGDGRLRAAGGAPQERHDLGASAGLVRGEGGAGRAVGDVLADGPLDGVVEVVGGLDVDEVHRLADLDGHGAGELAGAGAGRAVAGVDGERDVDGLAGLGVAAGEERDVAERILAGGGAVVELVSRLDGAAVVVAVVVGVERALVDGGDGALVKGHVVDGVVAAVALGGAQVAEEVALVEADAVALRDGVLDILAHEVDDDAAGVRHGRAAARGGAGIAGRVQGEVQRDGLRGGLGVGDERHAIEVGDLGIAVERAGGIAGGHGGAAIVQRALRGGGQGEGHVIEGDIGIGLGLAGVAAGLSDLVHEVVEVALRELDGLTGHTVVLNVVVGLGNGHRATVISAVARVTGRVIPSDDIQRALAARAEIGARQRATGVAHAVQLRCAVLRIINRLIGAQIAAVAENIELGVAGGSRHLIARVDRTGADRLGSLAVEAVHGHGRNGNRECDRKAVVLVGHSRAGKGSLAEAVDIRGKGDRCRTDVAELAETVAVHTDGIDQHRRDRLSASELRIGIALNGGICIVRQRGTGIVAAGAIISRVQLSRQADNAEVGEANCIGLVLISERCCDRNIGRGRRAGSENRISCSKFCSRSSIGGTVVLELGISTGNAPCNTCAV